VRTWARFTRYYPVKSPLVAPWPAYRATTTPEDHARWLIYPFMDTLIYLGYDRTSSPRGWNPERRFISIEEAATHDRARLVVRMAEEDGITLIGVLFHEAKKRNDEQRVYDLRAEMIVRGANAIFVAWLDRLAPTGWGTTWPEGHPLLRGVPVRTSRPRSGVACSPGRSMARVPRPGPRTGWSDQGGYDGDSGAPPESPHRYHLASSR